MFTAKTIARLLAVQMVFLFTAYRLPAALTGPTVQFNSDNGKPTDNPLDKFMYFVPLISPDPIAVSTNAGNTQRARVTSSSCQTNGPAFHAVCQFEIVGEGSLQNVFDHADCIRQHEKEMKAGKPLLCQLDAISIEGSGSGSVEINGTFTNGHAVASEVRLKFNCQGHGSPVCVLLHDIAYRNGSIHLENEMVARVNALTFHQVSGSPKMEISLASVKPGDADNSFWQNCMGKIRGVVANLLVSPLSVPADGHRTMMNFGLALATEQPSFTFPLATRLKSLPSSPLAAK